MNEEKKVKNTGTKASTGNKKETTKRKGTTSTNKASTAKKKSTTTAKKTTAAKSSTTKKASTAKKSTASKTVTKPKSTSATKKTTEKTKKTVSPVVEKEEVKNEKIIISETVPVQEEEIETPVLKEKIVEEKEVKPRKIKTSNYIVAAIIVIWVFIILYVGIQLYHKYEEKLYDEGYFYREKTEMKISTLKDIRKEIEATDSSNVFVLFNYRGEEANYTLEKDLYRIMKDYRLENSFYYIDLSNTEDAVNCDVTCAINQELGTNLVLNTPAIVYLKDKQVIDVAQREDKKVLEAADFVKVLDMYEFKK